MTRTSQLRLSGILITLVCIVMAASDLLMLTTLDFSRPYRFWTESAGLPQGQVVTGYFLGVLTIPFFTLGAWHLSLAIWPDRRWLTWLLLLSTAYSASLLTVWHAAFAFTRSILRAQGGVPGGEAFLAFGALAEPILKVAIGVMAPPAAVLFTWILLGRTLYPRWAGVILFGAAALFVFPPVAHLPIWATAVLGAARWNLGGATVFSLSTAFLWGQQPPAGRPTIG